MTSSIKLRPASKPLRSLLIAISAMGGIALQPVSAATVAVLNPGFEDITGESQSNEFTFGALNGWNLYESTDGQTSDGDGPDYYIGTLGPRTSGTEGGIDAFFDSGWTGDRVGIAYNNNGSGDGGEYGLVQVLSATLQSNVLYTLEVDIGNIGSGTSQSNTFFNLNGFPGYRVDLMAGDVILASDTNSLSIAERTFSSSTVQFQADASHAGLLGQALSIRLVNLNEIDSTDEDAHWEVDFDNVRLNASPVPEPSTSLFLAAFAGYFCLTRKR